MKIYYIRLNSNKIHNICGPESSGPAGWDEVTIKIYRKA